MKRIVSILLLVTFLALALASCEKSVYEIDTSMSSRTAAFYNHIKQNDCFWFEMELTNLQESYKFTQATNGANVTTILDYKGDTRDSYEIACTGEKSAIVHTLYIADRKYDSKITENYQKFLFEGENPETYANPTWTGDAEFDGKTYYAEQFETAPADGGGINGTNTYYFEEGRLIAVEVVEMGFTTMTMRFSEYGIELPANIYIEAPADFKKGTIEIESYIDFESMGWGDYSE